MVSPDREPNEMSANSAATLYGKGIFTTVAVRAGVPLLWEKHWARLTRDSAKVEVDMSAHPKAFVFGELTRAIKDNAVVDGRARITFLDQRPGAIWPGTAVQNTAMSIITAGPRGPAKKFSLTESPYRVNRYSPLTGVKSCNYLENILGIDEARGRGFDEGIRINDGGEMTGVCMANIYWLKSGVLFTPHLSTGCLPGTTREYILENIECNEVGMPIDTLIAVDAIFLSSAGLGVIQVSDLDNRTFEPVDHPILHLLP